MKKGVKSVKLSYSYQYDKQSYKVVTDQRQ